MFCRNCGKELTEGDSLCRNCGFDGNDGDTHCPHCGKDVLPKQKLCLHCGFLISEPSSPKEVGETTDIKVKKISKEEIYQKYGGAVKKSAMLTLVQLGLVVFLAIVMIFSPLFVAKMKPNNTDAKEIMSDIISGDFDDVDDLGQILVDGKIEKEFSLMDDAKLFLENMDSDKMSSDQRKVTNTLTIFYIFDLLGVVLLIASVVRKASKIIPAFTNPSDATLLEYNNLKKTGKKTKNISEEELRGLGLFLFMIVLHVVGMYSLGQIPNSPFDLSTLARMFAVSSVSAVWMLVLGVLLAAYVMVRVMNNKIKKEMLLQVTKADYDS